MHTRFSSAVVIESLKYRLVILDRMASFSWNRKIGEKVSKAAVEQFEAESAKEDKMDLDEVDWLHAVKRRREVLLEDCVAKSKRLKNEGELFAEQSRYVIVM